MVADAEETCQQLGLTYRVLLRSTGDLSFGSHKTYDLEVWAPGCQEWLEVSSVPNIGEFRAQREHLKYRQRTGPLPGICTRSTARGWVCRAR